MKTKWDECLRNGVTILPDVLWWVWVRLNCWREPVRYCFKVGSIKRENSTLNMHKDTEETTFKFWIGIFTVCLNIFFM